MTPAQEAQAEPKPCPFCGTNADVQDNFGREFWVQCKDLSCGSSDGTVHETPAKAIERWNRRAQPALAPVARPVQQPLNEAQMRDCAWGYVPDSKNLDDHVVGLIQSTELACAKAWGITLAGTAAPVAAPAAKE